MDKHNDDYLKYKLATDTLGHNKSSDGCVSAIIFALVIISVIALFGSCIGGLSKKSNLRSSYVHHSYSYSRNDLSSEYSYGNSDSASSKSQSSQSSYKRYHSKKESSSSDPYNAKDYYDAEDFYEDNYDDFFDYYDAEDYFDEHNDD